MNHILIEEQHDFRQRKFTVTSSVVFTSYLFEVIEQGGQVDVIFSDFKMGFDTVDHNPS